MCHISCNTFFFGWELLQVSCTKVNLRKIAKSLQTEMFDSNPTNQLRYSTFDTKKLAKGNAIEMICF